MSFALRRTLLLARIVAMQVSALYVYPVKSLRGFSVATADIDALGLIGDRRFLVTDPAGRFLTQRSLPQMALVTTALSQDHLRLSHPRAGHIDVPLRAPSGTAPLRTVSVWKSEGLLAEDCGESAATWLSDALHTPARLVRIGEKFHRPVLKPAARAGDVTTFSDAYPFMALSDASLDDLNQRLAERGHEMLPMNRFRPNIVIGGCPPYAEDTWPRLRIGSIGFRAGGPCARCIMTTIDQDTADQGKEPLALLSTYRRDANDPTRINFGQNLLHETKSGTIRVGDPVVAL